MALDLGKQIGPLPMGAWIVVVAGGLGIALWTRSQNSGTTTIERDSEGNLNESGMGGLPGTYTQLVPVANPSQGLEPEIKTNEDWGRAAIRWLIAQGYPAGVADSAIRKYLAVDESRSTQEYMLQTLALGHFGPPPNPLPPQETPPPTIPTPGNPTAPPPVVTPPPPAAVRTFTVTKWPKPGSSLWSIALIMYGNPLRWREIYNANRSKIGSNPNRIQPGWVLVIP